MLTTMSRPISRIQRSASEQIQPYAGGPAHPKTSPPTSGCQEGWRHQERGTEGHQEEGEQPEEALQETVREESRRKREGHSGQRIVTAPELLRHCGAGLLHSARTARRYGSKASMET